MDIGAQLHKLRTVKGLTLKELGKMSDVSSALLSQIERDKASPSVSSLKRIANSLDVSIAYFFEESNDSVFVTRKEDLNRLRTGSGVTYYLLSRDTTPSLEVILNVFEVGATTGEQAISHPGEECGIVLEGFLQIELASSIHILETGDTISYNSSIPHKLTNIGTVPVRAIWVNTPPHF